MIKEKIAYFILKLKESLEPKIYDAFVSQVKDVMKDFEESPIYTKIYKKSNLNELVDVFITLMLLEDSNEIKGPPEDKIIDIVENPTKVGAKHRLVNIKSTQVGASTSDGTGEFDSNKTYYNGYYNNGYYYNGYYNINPYKGGYWFSYLPCHTTLYWRYNNWYNSWYSYIRRYYGWY